jgi:hypothetical protein
MLGNLGEGRDSMKSARIRLMPLAVLVAFAGCGGDGPTTPAPYTQTMSGTVAVFGGTTHALSIPRSGQMSLVLTWTDSTIDLDLYLTATSCTALYPMANCTILVTSNSAVGAVRETIARSVNSGEAFTIWVDNLSTTKASTYNLNLTIQ